MLRPGGRGGPDGIGRDPLEEVAGFQDGSSFRAARAAAWIGLLTISECQTSERISEIITARYYSFADPAREAAQLGLIALPAMGWGIKRLRDKMELDRRRSLLSTYLRIATRAHLSGDFDRAIAEYSIAIKVDPARIETYLRRGQTWWQEGGVLRPGDRRLRAGAEARRRARPRLSESRDRPGRPRRPRRRDRSTSTSPPKIRLTVRRPGPLPRPEPGQARRARPRGRGLPGRLEAHESLRLRRAGPVPPGDASRPSAWPSSASIPIVALFQLGGGVGQAWPSKPTSGEVVEFFRDERLRFRGRA